MRVIVEKEGMNEENAQVYENIFKKQYTDLTYEIISEEYSGDEAIVKANINVYDYYKVQRDASIYLAEHLSEFNDDMGNYDIQSFFKYKLEQMQNTQDKIEYTIEFSLSKNDGIWQINELSNSDIEKLHGIYDYES